MVRGQEREHRFLRGLAWVPCLGFLVMWPTSYGFYTSVGIDVDRHEEPAAIEAHVRFRWPGNGAFLMGADQFRLPPDRKLVPLDLGAALFHAPRRPQPRSIWNLRGFWLIHEEYPPTELPVREPEKAAASWVGVPSWLPVVLTGAWPLLLAWRRRERT
ncbi:hypothetical protein [Melittangium boletus]|uniref:Uncharacterized protein n=1 Tax=Melittangium boletus DSM 14713 TaxID=1294270 RepID=A0A250ICT6_9BACT|nr:hypothetical protein [Melittangium boletus]ATB29575.1 hypothetical protein MEBOL_003030 [Melittangium boletus DSM 14713]